MTYDEVLKLEGKTVILFYGAACAPCQALKPLLREAMAAQQLRLVELNVAGELETARALRLRSVPSVVLVADGRPKVISTGPVPPSEVLTRLKGIL